ncbi:hypothetical protein RHCRD62_10424 [Rhodococcus sp. RD6.2]|nr:hypothetical protein RHCRD62_10424 [Rhodococcus sp. RD6.2]
MLHLHLDACEYAHPDASGPLHTRGRARAHRAVSRPGDSPSGGQRAWPQPTTGIGGPSRGP